MGYQVKQAALVQEGRVDGTLAPSEPVSKPHLEKRKHIPTLDGLRGIAVLMVLFGHFYRRELFAEGSWSRWIGGRVFGAGGLGVDLFFVLSGFLITGILLDQRGKKGAFVDFYARRSLRIFPLYFLSLALVLWILPFFVTFDGAANRIVADQVWLWTYTINFPGVPWIWDESSLFLLGHFWSLCVEEHFYLLWPPLAFCLPKKRLIQCCGLFIGVGISCRTISHLSGEGAGTIANWTTLQRLDALAIGSALAISVRKPQWQKWIPSPRFSRGVFLVLLCLLGVMVMRPRSWTGSAIFIGRETLAAVVFGTLLLWAYRLRDGDAGYRLLTCRFMVSFGKFSYGIYVIHGILRPAFTRIWDLSAGRFLSGLPWLDVFLFITIATGGSFLLAWLSYNLVEKRFLRLKRYFNYGVHPAPARA